MVKLWYCNIHDNLLETNFSSLCQGLSSDEHRYVNRFVFIQDRKRSLLGKLLQKALVCHTFPSISSDEIVIQRTKEVWDIHK
jgi:phosphopantetheinyl transferase